VIEPPRPNPHRRLALLLVAIFAGALSSCSRQAVDSDRRELEHGGRDRIYYVHLPPQAGDGLPLPVVLNFHGGGGEALGHERYTGMDALADDEGFIAVYPAGTSRFGDRLLTWNAGGCCGYAQGESIDDVGFVRAVIEDLATVTPIDRSRIYATGLSNGAMMAYRMAAEAGDLVAAIAPVAGAMKLEEFSPGRPIPILHIHSVDDPRALYNGGTGPPFPLTDATVDHEPVEAVLSLWAAFDGCPSAATAGETLSGEPRSANADQTATLWIYGPCTGGVEIDLWKLTGVGHVWPGGTPDYLTAILGPSTSIIDANLEMWAFFKRFSLPG
jgi:polyhydroxybutyrate depolymerase